jgi:sugar lactone lactonase YvrE
VKRMRRISLLAALLTAVIPIGAHANSGDLYATDNSSIRVYSPDGTSSIFASGLLRARGLAFDGLGNLFVATLDTATLFDGRGQVLKFAPDGTVTTFATGLDSPEGLAFDGAGNLYVVLAGRFTPGRFRGPETNPIGLTTGVGVTKISPGGVKNLFAKLDPTTFHENFGIAIDDQNNVFVADNLQGMIYQITPDGHLVTARSISTFISILTPIGLAFDRAGNLYASDTDQFDVGNITKIAPDGTPTPFVSGLEDLRGLAFDPDGNLFAAGHSNNVIYKITPDGSVSIFASGLNVPQFLTVEP